MFDLHCPHCHETSLVDASAILALRNTDDGPVAIVRCPNGHQVVHSFHSHVDVAA